MQSATVDLHPLFVAICFYLSVFIIAELTRKFVDKYEVPGSLLFCFLMEVIATAQMCTCVYENAVIIRHYGLLGFFFTVALLIFSGGIMNREAFVSPLVPIELYCKGTLPLKRLIVTLVGEMVGGYSAYRIARNLWYWSLNLSSDHAIFYKSTSCELVYKVPFMFVPAFEVFGCFLMRYILCRIPANFKKFVAPAVVSGFLTSALLFVGVAGLNPTVASSRLQGCEGLNTVWFVMTYWICPVIGWMLSALIDNRKELRMDSSEGKDGQSGFENIVNMHEMSKKALKPHDIGYF
uniref:Aquaporin n=1 Tax=Setaria digitata TaxID=48799 RepID=A0A915PW58_9BILA